jgi:phage minor structural protein
MAVAVGVIGRDLWGESLWAGERIGPRDPAVFRTIEYQLELRTSTGALTSVLRKWDNESWTEEVNRPDILTFTYPAEDDDAQLMVQPNQIWLRDSVTGTLLQRFRIIRGTPRGVFPDIMDVECHDFMSQLAHEWITSFVRTVSDANTFRQVLQGYLDFQDNTNRVTIGNLGSALSSRPTNTWATNKTILNAIQTIHQTVEGSYHVNAHRRIDWKAQLAPNRGQEFRRRKNMKGITETKRYDETVNRLYAYGHGSQRSTRLNLIDAGEANEYIDDAASIAALGGAAGGGIRAGYWKDGSIENAAQLLAEAQVILSQRKDPRLDYTIAIIDLSFSSRKALGYERLVLGEPRHIIDEKLGISTDQIVVKIVRSLSNPLQVEVNLSNIPRDMSALWKKVVRDQQKFQNEDADSPLTDTAGFEETIETVLGIVDAPTEIATWNAGADTGTLDNLMTDAIASVEPTMTGLDDLVIWDETGNDGNLDEKIEDMLGIGDIADICTWNEAGDTGNLDAKIGDMLNHDQTPILTTNAPEDASTGAAAVGTGTRGARDDHVHHYVDSGNPLSNSTPLSDSVAGESGNDAEVSRDDHRHPIPTYT